MIPKQALDKLTALLWLAVPFPCYCALVILAQPMLYEVAYGVTFLAAVPEPRLTLLNATFVFGFVLAIVVTGLLVAVTSWEMAKFKWRTDSGVST